MIFTEHDREVLKKFKNGGAVKTESDKEVVDRWARVGFVHCGYDWGQMCGTAKLCNTYTKHLNR
ncbi:MAG: hypothetical protein EMLJLAPB_00687 [Candidatus Argoarchaeum ethanivorans]|uniref:Uncharacterized protein n=1 Tax=Candidatus Argoarchaeum ethanivorans TaxID=2608793 RepID=A0A811TGZ6_9EURY|nr:MAG: hypothetical protein EMLJLAPB_00687 [Candidatus Argoarchaeum ethanivorans]